METDSADQLAIHLRNQHYFQSKSAGSIAQRVKYWKECDEWRTKDI
jgi:hypothetical protein